jgi:hypothetical protein
VERRREVFLAPKNGTGPNVDAPDILLRGKIHEMTNKTPTRNAQFEDSPKLLNGSLAL